MLVLVVVHFELFSLYNFLAWERLGVISGGEGFVILSGCVIGMVYRRRMEEQGLRAAGWKLFDRALQLYRVNVFVIVSVFLLSLLPVLDLRAVMTFTDRGSGTRLPALPRGGDQRADLDRARPHPARRAAPDPDPRPLCLPAAFSPLALYLLRQERWRLLLCFSWLLYVFNWAYPQMPTATQFEYAFPLLTWQLIYVHGMAAGYHRERVFTF